MVRRAAIMVALILAVASVSACDPQEGAPCHPAGKTWAHGGRVLHCRPGPGDDGGTWQR